MSYVEMVMTMGLNKIKLGRLGTIGWVLLMVWLPAQTGWAQDASRLEPTLMRLAAELVRFFPPVVGDVIRVENGQLYINLDQNDEVWPGLSLSVYREGKALKHPTSGAALGRVEDPLGRVTIVHVAERYVVADVVPAESTQPIQVGDKVRLTAGRLGLGLLPLVGPLPTDLTPIAFHDQLRQALDQTERFRPLAVDRAQVFLLERGVAQGDAIDLADRQALSNRLQTPYLIQPHTRLIQGQLAVDLKLLTPSQSEPVAVVSAVATGYRPSPAAPVAKAPSASVTPRIPAPSQPAVPPAETAPASKPAATPSPKSMERLSGLFREPLSSRPGELPLNVAEHMVEIHRVEDQLISLDVGDIDQDGTIEVVMLTSTRLFLYRLQDQKLVLVDTFKANRQGTLISAQFLQLGEASPLGIVVNHQLGEEGVDAFILTLQKGKLAYWQQHIYETLLAVDSDGDGLNDSVWGQALDEEKFFRRGRIRRYRPGPQALERQDIVVTPYPFRATGAALVRLQESADRQLVFVDEARHLQIYQDRDKVWESPASVGGSYGYATLPQTGELDIRVGDVLKQFFPFEPIPAVVDLDGDGIDEVLVIRNETAGLTKFVPNRTQWKTGDVAMLRAGPYGYSLTAISPKFDGTVSGLAIARSRQPSLFVAVTKTQGVLGAKKETIVFLSVFPPAS